MKPLSFLPVVAPATAARPRRLAGAAAAASFALLLSGCASGPPNDPLEPYNRGMATFNDNVDSLVLKPVATVYRDVTPDWFRSGVTNFFNNIEPNATA